MKPEGFINIYPDGHRELHQGKDNASVDAFPVFRKHSNIDLEAIGWAYMTLMAFGVHTSDMDNALMMDRLNLMLLQGDSHD